MEASSRWTRRVTAGTWRMDRTGQGPGAHPIAFLPLYLPYSLGVGYVSVALSLMLRRAGVSTQAIAALVAALVIVQLCKLIWAPLVDASLGVRRWWLLAAAVQAAALVGIGLTPIQAASLPTLAILVLALGLAASFIGMANESLIAHSVKPEDRGKAAGWAQAGNVCGSAVLGAAVGYWLAAHASPLIAAAALAGAIGASGLALRAVPEPSREHRGPSFLASLRNTVAECWAVARSRQGLMVLALFLLPAGAGAASDLFAAVSRDWGVTPDQAAPIASVAGFVGLLGALAGGRISDRFNRLNAYLAFGVALAVVALAMALAPRTPAAFVAFVLVYMLCLGASRAGSAALTLETIGKGAAATKYTLFASLGNAPIAYMTLAEGWARTRWNAGAMLELDGLTAIGSIALFLVIALASRRRALAPAG